jgi:hypothetical protein
MEGTSGGRYWDRTSGPCRVNGFNRASGEGGVYKRNAAKLMLAAGAQLLGGAVAWLGQSIGG